MEQPRLELSAEIEVSIQRNSCGVFIETEQLSSGFHGKQLLVQERAFLTHGK